MFNSTLKNNIAANFAGSFWQALMGLIFVPLYIKFMGIESYGLVGLFTTLQVIFGLLDVGLGSTLTREMARLSVLPGKEQEMRNLVRTLEMLYWAIAIFAGIIVVTMSSFIARYWIQAGQLSPETIEQALILMGIVMVFQMPGGFYAGGFRGLQRQVLLNIITICTGTLRGGGVVLILWLVSPTIQAFLLWQIVISMMNTFLSALYLWRNLPPSGNKAMFQKTLFSGIWRFTAGMSGISILSVILTQLDKVILSKLLSLEMFGYYMLASIMGMSLSRVFAPVFYSIFPQFTQLVSIGDQDSLKRLYHKICQFMAVLILPAAVIIAFFSYEVILLWTQNHVTAEKTHVILSILICGTAINGIMYLPYALQLAFGWTKLSFVKSVIAVVILVPLIIYMTIHYGATGAAIAWLVLNIGMFVFEIPIMHSKLLTTEKWRWYFQDVGVPLATCVVIAGIGRIVIAGQMPQLTLLLYLTIISALTLGMTAVTTSTTRTWLFEQLYKFKLA